ncbi:NADPH-dependent FMN reductase [Thermoactinomyces sp. DSM 45892]|uniref:NADPH-dependent FMN reductase n=1 Tax=Thermoactinomyces sp. DSM 45892 TaxID=1882753 RepID=UPI0015A39043|nr:NADPH-dependent FMN reductase [Thermoactinomyces sp. DSM 45892]
MQILVISGSARVESNTRKVANLGAKYLSELGADVTFFDVGHDILPLYSGAEGEDLLPNVQKLRDYASQAEAFLILTPEYHSAMSGSLKNALDFLGSSYFRQKPVSIAAAGGGGKGGINALNNVRTVIRGILGLGLPQQVVIDPADLTENGQLTDGADQRFRGVIEELVTFTKAVSASKVL